MMENIYEKKIEVSDQIIKNLQNDKETLLETIEGQDRILDLLYDDMDKKNKEIDDLKKLLDKNKKENLEFEKRKKQFVKISKQFEENICNRTKQLEVLRTSIKNLRAKYEQPKARCSFEWKCRNLVCRFDHSYLNCKINTYPKKVTSNLEHHCSFCERILHSGAHLEAHIKRCHGEHCLKTENCVTCRVCEEKFVNKSALDKHTREAHSSSHLECAKCGKYFVTEKEVEEHMLIHVDEENFVKEITSRIDAVLNKKCDNEIKEPSKMGKLKNQKKEHTVSTKKMPAKKLRKPIKFEDIEQIGYTDEEIEEDFTDDSLTESDEISGDEDSSSGEESGGECEEEISYAVQ